ncbi:MAG: tandem-95 repeat protein, partial [Sedimenticola sp.]
MPTTLRIISANGVERTFSLDDGIPQDGFSIQPGDQVILNGVELSSTDLVLLNDDLMITLPDGQVLVMQNFFAVGEQTFSINGEPPAESGFLFSRLSTAAGNPPQPPQQDDGNPQNPQQGDGRVPSNQVPAEEIFGAEELGDHGNHEDGQENGDGQEGSAEPTPMQALAPPPAETESGPINATPVALDDAGGSTDEDTPFTTGNVLGNDTDDDGDTLSVSAVDTRSTAGAAITDNGNGTFNYDPNGAFEGLAEGDTTTDTFEYTVSDGKGGIDTATVSVEVNGVNDAPVNDAILVAGNEDDLSVLVTLSGSDMDGSITSFNLASLSANGTLYTDSALSNQAQAGIDYAATGDKLTLYFVPATDWHGDTNFSFTATDNLGASGTTTNVVIRINAAPETTDTSASGLEDTTSLIVNLVGSDVDGTVASFSLSGLPANGTLYIDASLNIQAQTGTDYTASGNALSLYFVPAPDWNGHTSFDYLAKDNLGLADGTPATATINVSAVNDAPETATATASGDEDVTSITVTLTGSDVDGTVASFSLSGLPNDGTLYTDAGLNTLAQTATDYAASGNALSLYFVPDADWSDEATFDYAATDDSGTEDASTATATITVNPVN